MFLFEILLAILLGRAELFYAFLLRVLWQTFVWNYFKEPVIQEGMLFKDVFFLFLALAAIMFGGAEPFFANFSSGHYW